MSKKPHILFLNQLADNLLVEHDEIRVSCEPIIEISELDFDCKNWNRNIPWVFTSGNASRCFCEIDFPSKVYAVGPRTASNIPNALIPKIHTAVYLAELIIENKEQEVMFICGDNRRGDLLKGLNNADIKVLEKVVYSSRILKKSIDLRGVDALAFMSPSSVKGLMQNGGFNNLPCFAIGPSTERELIRQGQDLILSKESSSESIIEKAIEYFAWHSPIKETEG
ncbi:MAG: hypothetical protein COA49_05825 [Bacteroidetes bacterium]|nr:MAG: hypothetical protein COA49_05825 [Bacteroidota bacterium]